MEDGRAERLRQRQAFWFAWGFLVLVIALGFFVQARVIDRLEEDERLHRIQIEDQRQRTTNNAEALCGLLVDVAPYKRDAIVTTFRDLGYGCAIR